MVTKSSSVIPSSAVFLSQRVFIMTAKPARLHASVAVDIPYPRRLEDERVFEKDKELRRLFFAMPLDERSRKRPRR